MARMALYRAWRSQTFEDVVGQRHITQTLQNSLREGRLSHAYLLTGPRGTGKTSTAKILAKAVNCERGPAAEPCNECDSCKRITAGNCIDVNEFDAASNRGVEEIRDIRDKVKYAPTEVKTKVYIIDEVHMLTTEAFNALLKTLEEPPSHVLFILATTEPHKVPATIHSRCQRFDFRRVSPGEQAEHMRRICSSEGIEAEDEALTFIARLSDGGMRDALSILDQAVSYTGNKVTYDGVVNMTGGVASEQYRELALALRERDVSFVLTFVDRLMREGKSADKCLEGFLSYLRDLLLIKLAPGSSAVRDRLSEAETERLNGVAGDFAHERLFQMIDTVNGYLGEMRYAAQPQTMLEVALLKLCSLEEGVAAGHAAAAVSAGVDAGGGKAVDELTAEVRRLAARLERLESRGVSAPPSQAAAVSPPSGVAAGKAAEGSAPSVPVKTPMLSAKTVAAMSLYIEAKDSPDRQKVSTEWASVLGRVKERSVSVHAWLVNGELVSAANGSVLVAFKNTIHRETTEKPSNKQLIETVMAEQFGHPYRLVTVMLSDWQAALETAAGSSGAVAEKAPEFELVSDEDDGKSYKEEWINEAIELFGEDIVVVKE